MTFLSHATAGPPQRRPHERSSASGDDGRSDAYASMPTDGGPNGAHRACVASSLPASPRCAHPWRYLACKGRLGRDDLTYLLEPKSSTVLQTAVNSQPFIVYSKSIALTMTTRFPSKGPSSKAELGSADPEALTYRRIYSSTIAYVESLPATHLRALARLRELLARLDLRCSE